MQPYSHQESISDEAYEVLGKYGIVYLGMEERTGKTLASILTAEKTSRHRVLVLTKKKALMGDKDKKAETAKEGWYGTLNKYGNTRCTRVNGYPHWGLRSGTEFTVLNYHAVHTAVKKKGKTTYKLNINPDDYDLIILDEGHSYLSAYPKLGAIWKSVKKLCVGQPLIYLSATPYAQGYQLLFNQLRLSDWSPFRAYKDFYRFFDAYGIPSKVRTSYGLQETYKKCKPSVWEASKHLFITYTRAELDFEHEPEDVIHHVELTEETKSLYNSCMRDEMMVFVRGQDAECNVKTVMIPLDSSMKMRTTLHQIEGGVYKEEDTYGLLQNTEKIDAILRDFGDTDDTVIMYHYKAERIKLEASFKEATLLQATSYAEGVDLSSYRNLVIYSQDFSTARHSQRRARQANKERKEPIRVHFYLVHGAISEQVYKTVSINKANFIDSLFTREAL